MISGFQEPSVRRYDTGHCTAGGSGGQTSGYLLALPYLCTSKLPSRSPVVGNYEGGTTAWAYMVNIARWQPTPANARPEHRERSVCDRLLGRTQAARLDTGEPRIRTDKR